MDIQSTKILVAVLFFLIRFSSGILPLKLYTVLRRWEGDDSSHTFINQKRHNQVNCAIALCQSFGGGVLFATCFLHMMIEVYKSMEELKRFDSMDTEYPLSQLTICMGFFFVYFLEELSHWIITRIPAEPCPSTKSKINNFTHSSVTPVDNGDKPFIIGDEYEKNNQSRNILQIDAKLAERDNNSAVTSNLEKKLSIDENHENRIYDTLSLNSEVARENQKNSDMNRENINLGLDDDINETLHEEMESKNQEVESETKTQQQIMRCLMVVLALSSHAIFEGLAIGLQNDSANIWYLFIGVSIHSATILFCIGLELLLARSTTRNIYLLMFTLAIASPLGVILGLFVTIKSNLETRAKSTAVVLLEGLSAGTILYITFFEVLNREKERRVYRIPRAICILGGFSLMAFLQYLEVYH